MALSVVMISKNEEGNIVRSLESVKWADEIILIDSQSEDRTVEIARELGAKVFSPEWKGYGPAKMEGVNRASHDWILSIDADEVVSPELAAEIKKIIAGNSEQVGYYVPRITMFLGRWIKHCGWYPDYVLRLFRKSHGNFDGAVVHEKVVVDGPTAHMTSELLHYSYVNLDDYFEKFNRYTTMGAEEAYRKGAAAGWFDLVVKPPVAFIKHFISKQGFRDGLEGFLISVLSSIAVMVKYAKLREMHKTGKNRQKD